MHGKDFLVDDRRNGQAIEAVGKCLPQLNVVTSLAFVIEPVYAINRGALMVASKDEEVLRVLYFVRKQQTNRLQGLLPSINVVSKKEVISFRGKTSILEKSKKVVVLPVYVAADLEARNSLVS